MKINSTVIGNLLLAASVCFSAAWIGQSIKQVGDVLSSVPSFSLNEKGLLNRYEASKYLSMPEDQFYFILQNIEIEKQSQKETWDDRKMIHTLSFNGIDYYSRKELDRWIEFNITPGTVSN